MVEQVSQRVFDVVNPVLDGRRPGRNDKAIMQGLGAKIMFLSPHLHGDRAIIIGPAAISPGLSAKPETCKDARELCDFAIAVGRNRLPKSVELPRAIRI